MTTLPDTWRDWDIVKDHTTKHFAIRMYGKWYSTYKELPETEEALLNEIQRDRVEYVGNLVDLMPELVKKGR